MTNITVIENKTSAVKRYLKILERYKKYPKNKIEEDLDIRGAVERYLYLAVQATIDLAEAVIAYKGLRKPATMSDAFYILQDEGIISSKFTSNMVKMVGFRNVIAHDYEKINYDIVYDVLHKGLKDINGFLKKIAKL